MAKFTKGGKLLVLTITSSLLLLLRSCQTHNQVWTKNNGFTTSSQMAQSLTAPCGIHGSRLIDRCICDPGYNGKLCNQSVIVRNHKCRFDPHLDVCWNVPGIGRFRVASKGRQQLAFSCEIKFWEITSVPKRNRDQLLAFGRFLGLPQDLGSVVEIGAGPYTKAKLILETRPDVRVKHVTLVDPLIQEYATNTNIHSSYPKGILEVNNGVHIPTTLIEARGEELLPVAQYDTAILVNTLEHCSNAVMVLNNVYECLKPGGILIFGESFAREMELLSSDACHPIQLMHTFLMEYLANYQGVAIIPPRYGETVKGIEHIGMKRSLFAIVRKSLNK
jgi:SAM-dependent methyltransferase